MTKIANLAGLQAERSAGASVAAGDDETPIALVGAGWFVVLLVRIAVACHFVIEAYSIHPVCVAGMRWL
jgi:hypothetical protein